MIVPGEATQNDLSRTRPYMKITSVRVIPFEAAISGGMVRAYAEVELDGEVLLRGIQVIETDRGGWFLSYPTLTSRGGRHDVVVFQDKKLKDAIRRTVLDELRGEEKSSEDS
ncbi:MAG: septation protein SpoVG family protein [Nitrospinota bacterium]